MKFKRNLLILIKIILCLSLVVAVTGCLDNNTQDDSPDASPEFFDTSETPDNSGISDSPGTVVSPTPDPTPTPPPVNLVAWEGDVEHLFFHEVIAFPDIAFPNRTDPHRLDDYMVTVNEFNLILESLHRNGFIIVGMHDVWSEFTNVYGQQEMRRNTLMLPENRRPIILTFDDLTFHLEPYDAFMHRYIIGPDGEVWAEGVDRNGNPLISQDYTAITILDRFIRNHPDFSHNGARGGIAQTGLFGILGYQTQTNINIDTEEFRLNRMKEIARVRPVIERLNETGWYWASHSWGHIRFDASTLDQVIQDAERWENEVGSLVGRTTIMIYAHGGRLDGATGGDVWVDNVGPAARHYIDELGFRMFASVGPTPFVMIRQDVPAVMMDRMAVDGITLRNARDRFLRFYDAAEVFDPLRPHGEINWD
ncbi:MAG: hydrolase [Oscillospiraceae bacterium]|nr:hydrolase [Oscillospiraceae bacterium]